MSAQHFYNVLVDHSIQIGQRYRAVFELKSLNTEEAVKLMMKSFDKLGSSELMKHELVYTLGQLNQDYYHIIKDFLFGLVEDEKEQKLVRHQAAEAIANYFDPKSKELFEKSMKSEVEYLAMTCEVALFKLTHHTTQQELYGTKYMGTREPIAPFSEAEFQEFLTTHNLKSKYQTSGPLPLFLSPIPLPDKYRILYYLRNLQSSLARLTLCQLLSLEHYKSQPALLKHEICFVLGQIGIEQGEQEKLIRQCIENLEQEDIVRHEALAAVASQSKDEKYLEKFVKDDSQLIRESALVAIDEIKYWKDM